MQTFIFLLVLLLLQTQKRLVSVLPNDDFIYLGSVSLFFYICTVSYSTANQCMHTTNTWHIWYDRSHQKRCINIFARLVHVLCVCVCFGLSGIDKEEKEKNQRENIFDCHLTRYAECIHTYTVEYDTVVIICALWVFENGLGSVR